MNTATAPYLRRSINFLLINQLVLKRIPPILRQLLQFLKPGMRIPLRGVRRGVVKQGLGFIDSKLQFHRRRGSVSDLIRRPVRNFFTVRQASIRLVDGVSKRLTVTVFIVKLPILRRLRGTDSIPFQLRGGQLGLSLRSLFGPAFPHRRFRAEYGRRRLLAFQVGGDQLLLQLAQRENFFRFRLVFFSVL